MAAFLESRGHVFLNNGTDVIEECISHLVSSLASKEMQLSLAFAPPHSLLTNLHARLHSLAVVIRVASI